MTKRFNISNPIWPRQVDWPTDPTNSQDLGLFSARTSLRKLILMVDNDVLAGADSNTSTLDKATLLAGLMTHPFIKAYKFADDGPPADLVPELFNNSPCPVYKDWVTIGAYNESTAYWPVVYTIDIDEYTASGIDYSQIISLAKDDTLTSAYSDLASDKAKERREADAKAAKIASDALQADIYVTTRPYLHSQSHLVAALSKGVTICTLDEVLSLISLYLRVQKQYILSRTISGQVSLSQGSYFVVGTRELLPSTWRWLNACIQHSNNGASDTRTFLLGIATLQRFSRALQARDGVHIAMNRARNNDTTESALAKLDEVLYLLMGAADATARVAHIALNISGQERIAGWQNQSWLRSVANQEPTLAALVQNGASGEHTINILRLLRNSIHGEGLQGLSLLHERERHRETLLTLSQDDEPALLSAMDALGGRMQWGVRPIVPGRIHIEPDAFVDKLFESVIKLLNQVMTHTPVERLSDVRLTPADSSPPADQPNNINAFSENSRHSIRWQLGF